MAGFAIQLNKNRWVCYIHVMILGTFMPLQSGSWNQFVCLYACNSWKNWWMYLLWNIVWDSSWKIFQGIWFSILTRQVQWPLDTKDLLHFCRHEQLHPCSTYTECCHPECVRAYVVPVITYVHTHVTKMKWAYIISIPCSKTGNFILQIDWLALYPSCTITMEYNSTCRLIVVLLLGFV